MHAMKQGPHWSHMDAKLFRAAGFGDMNVFLALVSLTSQSHSPLLRDQLMYTHKAVQPFIHTLPETKIEGIFTGTAVETQYFTLFFLIVLT